MLDSTSQAHASSRLWILSLSLNSLTAHLAWSYVLLQGFPNLSLIAIGSSTVDVAVAHTKGILHSCFYLQVRE